MITPKEFEDFLGNHLAIKKILTKRTVIPDFESFCNDITKIYVEIEKNKDGNVADYIPQLARVNPAQFALSFCSIDGQRFSIGDYKTNFCLQSSCKPINYCLALEKHGQDIVHSHVGREPN